MNWQVGFDCSECGARNEISDDFKRWIIRIYEAATGKVLLPAENRWIHKRMTLTPMLGDAAVCGAVQQTGNMQRLQWRSVTCPRCLAWRRQWAP